MNNLNVFLIMMWTGILPSILLADTGDAVVEAQSVDLLGMLIQGGWGMYPLGFCSLALLFLTFHGFRETQISRFRNPNQLTEMAELMLQGETATVLRRIAREPTVLSRILKAALPKARPELADGNREAVEIALVEAMELEENNLSQWIHYLNVVAAIAPMIGLLGTVSGMIGAFQTIGTGGMGKPEALAGDIGEALITTAAGLVIGIPAMVIYFVLRNRLGTRVLETMRTATWLMDHLDSRHLDPDLTEINP